MIKNNELRLGNWVLYKEKMSYDEWEVYISAIQEDVADLSTFHSVYIGIKWSQINPLALGSWHLEYARFDKVQESIYVRNEWSVDLTSKTAIWKQQHVFSNVEYVHQLQNLVFAVSGWDIDFQYMGAND